MVERICFGHSSVVEDIYIIIVPIRTIVELIRVRQRSLFWANDSGLRPTSFVSFLPPSATGNTPNWFCDHLLNMHWIGYTSFFLQGRRDALRRTKKRDASYDGTDGRMIETDVSIEIILQQYGPSRSVGAETKKSAFYIGAIWQWVRFRQTDEFPPNHMYGGFYRGLGFRVSANNMGPRIVE